MSLPSAPKLRGNALMEHTDHEAIMEQKLGHIRWPWHRLLATLTPDSGHVPPRSWRDQQRLPGALSCWSLEA